MIDIPELFQSVIENSPDELRIKLFRKLDVNICDPYGQTCLHISASLGYTDIVDILINFKANVNCKDMNGVTPLLKACASNRHKIVNLLVRAKADVNCRDNDWNRVIHVCSANNSMECLRVALPHVLASINIADKNGRTALHHAVINGHVEIVKLLLDYDASVNVADNNGVRPIHWAASRGNVKIINMLIEKGANINSRDNDGYSPLHVASSLGHTETVVNLIERYAELDSSTNSNNNALHLACTNSHTVIVEELIKALNSPHLFLEHLKLTTGEELLSTEIKEGHQRLIKERFESLLNAANDQGLTPLHMLCQSDNVARCIETLLAYGASPNVHCEDGKTPLHFATMKNQTEYVMLLINASANVNLQDENDNAPLHIACKYGYEELVEKLLDNKADLFSVGQDGMLPLHLSVYHGHHITMQIILDHVIRKTHINNLEYDNFGRNLIHCAVIGGSLKCLETILRLGGDFLHEDNTKQTPLHVAVKLNNFIVTRILLKLGANVNGEDEYSCTPLHYAAMNNKQGNIIKLLISSGANVTAKVVVNDPMKFIEPSSIENPSIDIKVVYPVHFAAISGNCEGMLILLDAMDKDSKLDSVYGSMDSSPCVELNQSKNVISLVSLAAYHDQFEILNALIRLFSQDIISIQDRNGRTPLHLAAYQGYTSIVKYLLSCGGKPTTPDNDYLWNVLHYAASQGSVDVITEIIQSLKGEQRQNIIDSLDEHKRSSLMIAVQNGHVRAAEKLIINKAIVDREDTYGRTALHRSAANGHMECVDLLLAYNARIDLADFRGRTAFHMAATGGYLDILRKLVEFMRRETKDEERFLDNLKQVWLDNNNFSPLHFSAAKGHKDCFDYLYSISFDLLNTNCAMTPLHCAIEAKCEETLESILRLTGDYMINMPDCNSWTPIFYSLFDDNHSALKLLLNSGADPNYQDKEGRTPFLIAAKFGSMHCLETLLECVTLKWAVIDNNGRNILHYASECQDDSIGLYILQKLPKISSLINVQDKHLQTPAHLAASHGLPQFLNGLISKKANLFVINERNQLPITSCGNSDKISECIALCLSAMFPNDAAMGLSLKNLSSKKSTAVNFKDVEMEGSIQSSENEYF